MAITYWKKIITGEIYKYLPGTKPYESNKYYQVSEEEYNKALQIAWANRK